MGDDEAGYEKSFQKDKVCKIVLYQNIGKTKVKQEVKEEKGENALDRVKRFAVKNRFCQILINILFLGYSALQAFCFFCMRIFPIQEKKVVCCCVKGKRFGDNPMFIAQELLKRNNQYEIVWLLNREVQERIPQGMRRVNSGGLRQIYELVTASIWIDSNTKIYGTLKRKGQLYIQTWHGSYGLKKVHGDIPDKMSFIDIVTMKHNSRIADLYISNSKKTTEIYRRAFWYQGKMIECGSPRNDIFFEDTEPYISKVRMHFETGTKKLLLYAPTFRKDFQTDIFQMDYHRLAKTMEKRFGGNWIVLVRLHPNNMAEAEKVIQYDNVVRNATDYNIMQELLVACDALITDYSSCMFDFVTKGKPCFLYIPDIIAYKEERDIYFELDELPFPYARTNDQLEEVIMRFENHQYQRELQQLFEKVGLCESGHASARVVDYIEQWKKVN